MYSRIPSSIYDYRPAQRSEAARRRTHEEATVSIEVHCPNAWCGQVHHVKNRWAGR
jgi:hypothetical protein